MTADKSTEELFLDRFKAELPYLVRDKIRVFKDLELPNKTGILTISYTPYTIVKCTGIFSLCRDNKHIPLFDFDNILESRVLRDIEVLQEKYPLSTAYLLTTRRMLKNNKDLHGNYLVFFLEKFLYRDVIKMVNETHADDLYKRVEDFQDKGFVIRTSQKGVRPAPELIKIIPNRNSNKETNEKSNAHRIFFEKWLDIKIQKDARFDNQSKYQLVRYSTFA